MSKIIEKIMQRYRTKLFAKEKLDTNLKNAMDIKGFCGEIGIEDAEINVLEDNASSTPININGYIAINSYNSVLTSLMSGQCTYASLMNVFKDSPMASATDYEDVIKLYVLDKAAARVWNQFDTFGDFLDSIDANLFAQMDNRKYFISGEEKKYHFLALALRLSWEIEYLEKMEQAKMRFQVNDPNNSDEKRYKEKELKKINKRFEADGVQLRWDMDRHLFRTSIEFADTEVFKAFIS